MWHSGVNICHFCRVVVFLRSFRWLGWQGDQVESLSWVGNFPPKHILIPWYDLSKAKENCCAGCEWEWVYADGSPEWSFILLWFAELGSGWFRRSVETVLWLCVKCRLLAASMPNDLIRRHSQTPVTECQCRRELFLFFFIILINIPHYSSWQCVA